jgi:hypothetical protein
MRVQSVTIIYLRSILGPDYRPGLFFWLEQTPPPRDQNTHCGLIDREPHVARVGAFLSWVSGATLIRLGFM